MSETGATGSELPCRREVQLPGQNRFDGCVTVAAGTLSDRFLFIQDATGGIKAYLTSARGNFPVLHLGDRIAVRGRVRSVSGERQVQIEDLGQLVVRGACVPSTIHHSTGAIGSSFEGMLIEVSGALVSASGYHWILNDGSGDVQIYIDTTAGIRWPRLERGQIIRVAGVVSRASGRTVVIPRYQTDLTFSSSPTRTATRLVRTASATARPTLTQTPAPTTTGTPTATPTELRVFVRPTIPPVEPKMTIDAHAVATVGGSVSVAASFVLFALAWLVWRRR